MSQVTFTSWEFWSGFAALLMILSAWKALATHRAARPWVRQTLLLTFSLAVYTWLAKEMVCVLIASILFNHGVATFMVRGGKRQSKAWLVLGLAFNILLLATFKYAYFVADLWPSRAIDQSLQHWNLEDWMLPLGISFYTFQAISFIVDVHRGTIEKQPSLLAFATYLTFFPQLVAGPIVRAKQFLPQLDSDRWTSSRDEDNGHVQLILSGFLKKLVLGDLVGAWVVDPAFQHPTEWHSWEVLVALYGYSLQVYADFSGYTDMAKGMAGLLGITLPDNFNFPYRATTPSDFWRRWHMTLSAWWKDYVYIPLGGNRDVGIFSIAVYSTAILAGLWAWGDMGGAMVVLGLALLAVAGALMSQRVHRKLSAGMNAMLVMLIGGLWHGAHLNFVTWGALNGLVLVVWVGVSPRMDRLWTKLAGWAITFHSVVLARIWFRSGSLIAWDETTSNPHPEDAWKTAQLLWQQLNASPPRLSELVWDSTYLAGMVLIACGYALHWVPSAWRNRLQKQATLIPLWATWLVWCATTTLAIWCSLSYPKPFIYWQF